MGNQSGFHLFRKEQEEQQEDMGIFHQFVQAVNKEYDRRIRRASEVIEYGMSHGHGHDGHDGHHGHGHAPAHGHGQGSHQDEDDTTEEPIEISNIPRGTRASAGASRASDHA